MYIKSYKDLRASMTDEQKAESDAMYEKYMGKTPEILKNLIWADGEMYYLIDGKRIEVGEKLPEIMEAINDSFDKQASDECYLHGVEDIDNPGEGGTLLTKEDRKRIINKQILHDVKG